jgi:hypothetical protein
VLFQRGTDARDRLAGRDVQVMLLP